MDEQTYLNINPEQISDFAKTAPGRPVVMLNLVKYKMLVPETGITGKEAYKEYMRKATPFFQKVNAEVLFYGSPKHMLIGPEEESLWDDVLLVKYNAVSDFMKMVKTEGYPAHLRAQALEDSRLIHCTPN
ncbi:MAG: hypothetical protein WBB27_04370 [Maribacter sp.]